MTWKSILYVKISKGCQSKYFSLTCPLFDRVSIFYILFNISNIKDIFIFQKFSPQSWGKVFKR